jgi:hypothetical protein
MALFNFSNGQGQFTDVQYGTHNVNQATTVLTGYNKATLPATVTVDGSATPIAMTVGATGTLYLHAVDVDSPTTPIAGVQFIRVYKDYVPATPTTYGTATTATSATGDTTFTNVPFAATGAPNIYFTLVTTPDYILDPTTYPNGFVTTTVLTENDSATFTTVSLKKIVDQNFTITDANYANLPIETGTISLS